MGMKEKMMDSMMDGMSAQEKKEMMDKMMDRFFSDMTEDEKRSMMSEMMPKMMGSGMGGGMGAGMMGMMMGGKEGMPSDGNPMDMCKNVMGSFQETAAAAKFATPEVRGLFDEWAVQIEEEILSFIQTEKEIDPEKIAAKFKLSKESVVYFLKRLADKGNVRFDI